MKNRLSLVIGLIIIGGVLVAVTSVLLWWSAAFATEPPAAPVGVPAEALGWALVGAAVATGLAALGAGIAVANVGAAAVGAIAEKPELFGRVLILVGLAEGIAIYGLIISILILDRLG